MEISGTFYFIELIMSLILTPVQGFWSKDLWQYVSLFFLVKKMRYCVFGGLHEHEKGRMASD